MRAEVRSDAAPLALGVHGSRARDEAISERGARREGFVGEVHGASALEGAVVGRRAGDARAAVGLRGEGEEESSGGGDGGDVVAVGATVRVDGVELRAGRADVRGEETLVEDVRQGELRGVEVRGVGRRDAARVARAARIVASKRVAEDVRGPSGVERGLFDGEDDLESGGKMALRDDRRVRRLGMVERARLGAKTTHPRAFDAAVRARRRSSATHRACAAPVVLRPNVCALTTLSQ